MRSGKRFSRPSLGQGNPHLGKAQGTAATQLCPGRNQVPGKGSPVLPQTKATLVWRRNRGHCPAPLRLAAGQGGEKQPQTRLPSPTSRQGLISLYPFPRRVGKQMPLLPASFVNWALPSFWTSLESLPHCSPLLPGWFRRGRE